MQKILKLTGCQNTKSETGVGLGANYNKKTQWKDVQLKAFVQKQTQSHRNVSLSHTNCNLNHFILVFLENQQANGSLKTQVLWEKHQNSFCWENTFPFLWTVLTDFTNLCGINSPPSLYPLSNITPSGV